MISSRSVLTAFVTAQDQPAAGKQFSSAHVAIYSSHARRSTAGMAICRCSFTQRCHSLIFSLSSSRLACCFYFASVSIPCFHTVDNSIRVTCPFLTRTPNLYGPSTTKFPDNLDLLLGFQLRRARLFVNPKTLGKCRSYLFFSILMSKYGTLNEEKALLHTVFPSRCTFRSNNLTTNSDVRQW